MINISKPNGSYMNFEKIYFGVRHKDELLIKFSLHTHIILAHSDTK